MRATTKHRFIALGFLLACSGPCVSAQGPSANYTFAVGAGFACSTPDTPSCPAVARSPKGDSYELAGAGVFDVLGKTVRAAGTFTHRSADGKAVQTGVWIAAELVDFTSYGVNPSEAIREQRLLGGPNILVKRPGMLSGAMASGGLATFQIQMLPAIGPARTAKLQVNCALGRVPEDRAVQGIRLAFDGGADFSEEAGGQVMFLATRTMVNARASAPVTASPVRSEQP